MNLKIGLALSGGGARGVFHIGVLQALEEHKIEISIVSGTSAGAIVGSLFCAGVSPKEIMDLALQTSWYKFLVPGIPSNGLTKLSYLKDILSKNIPENTFESLKIPLVISATNMNLGILDLFDRGELYKPVLASCSIPMIFKPVHINNQMYLDGGILMNLPATPIKRSCDFLIGSSLIPLTEVHNKDLTGYFNLMTRVLELSVHNNSSNQKKQCDILIETDKIAKFPKFDLKEARELYKLGYETTQKILSQSGVMERVFN
ncbi:MAG: patatin-like phospholipase family protein [Bacteroidota bacterium]|nr:patatin-like phospholipase family protein [Bacteroidota bacterium]